MGKKYIIEIGRLERLYKAFVSAHGKPEITWLSPEVDLTPYTEPDLERVRKEAYEDGYKTAKVQCNIQAEKDMREVGERHYQRGLADAWEAARKICANWVLPDSVLSKIFGKDKTIDDIMIENTASEAIATIRAYEQEKGKIQVGDQVENTQTGVKFIVTHLWKNNRGEQGVSGFNRECSAFSTTLSLVVKTGRHFPEIATVLEKMRENNG